MNNALRDAIQAIVYFVLGSILGFSVFYIVSLVK